MIDRRCFIQKSALLAAGTAVVGAIAGCELQYVHSIPCLSVVPPPAPVPGTTYIRASQIGCALDCDLRTGRNKYHGGAATDDGPRINAAMAGATADHPFTLIIDGSALISGLFLPAAGHWGIAGLGCGTGFFIKTGTNNDGIHNGDSSALATNDPGPPAPARGSNVSLSNFVLNGNQGNGHDGDSTEGWTQGNFNVRWLYCINLTNLDNITIQNVAVVNSPSYHIRLSNVGHVAVSGCVFQSIGPSTDGLHFDGPANDIAISNCDFSTDDDSIALNCPEGYSGSISNVAVTGCTFNSWSLMRLYTTLWSPSDFVIDNVSVSNCSGTLVEAAFLIGLTNLASQSLVANLSITDCNLKAPTVIAIAENFGAIALKNVTFVASQSKVDWKSPQTNRDSAFFRPSPLYPTWTYVGSSLSFENCVFERNSDSDAAAVILQNNSQIKSMSFNGFAVQNAGSSSPMRQLLYLESGSIGRLILGAVDSASITVPVAYAQFSNIDSVGGAGVLATGWEFPDNVMLNDVPYISANSGLPSMKVNGIVEPYPLP